MQTHTEPICLDLMFQDVPGVIASWLVPGENGWVLVDCGPATTVSELERAVNRVGLEMGEIERIVLTHIHLDHAGGSGTLLQRYRHLRVSVHRGSAGILVDPERLIRSAARSYGDAMQVLWGDIVPVSPNQIDVIEPGATVPGTSLRAIATPGHTATHLAFMDDDSGTLFTGDAAHARLPQSNVIVPTLSPVEVDIEAWSRTSATLQELRPSVLALPHFGLVPEAADHLARIDDRIRSRMDIADRVVRSPDDIDALASALAAQTRDDYTAEGGDIEARVATMEMCMPSWLGAQGILRWYKVHNRFLPDQGA